MKYLRVAVAGFSIFVASQFSSAQDIDAIKADSHPPHVQVGLSESETKLNLPWFVDEFIQAANTQTSPTEFAQDYADRMRQGF
ncbi:hypothetical protein C5O80_30415 [Burkholderia sp. SRS-46]|nr:hypothetical protein C5O80_30415 [Burkholderia sp. SRS-46]